MIYSDRFIIIVLSVKWSGVHACKDVHFNSKVFTVACELYLLNTKRLPNRTQVLKGVQLLKL